MSLNWLILFIHDLNTVIKNASSWHTTRYDENKKGKTKKRKTEVYCRNTPKIRDGVTHVGDRAPLEPKRVEDVTLELAAVKDAKRGVRYERMEEGSWCRVTIWLSPTLHVSKQKWHGSPDPPQTMTPDMHSGGDRSHDKADRAPNSSKTNHQSND